jgi:thioredoxin 1
VVGLTLATAPYAGVSTAAPHPARVQAPATVKYASAVIEVNSVEQFSELLDTEPRLIVMFTATWCGPCRIMKPEFDRQSMEHGTVTFASVDVDRNPELADRFRVTAVPTFFAMVDGTQHDYFSGANRQRLDAMVHYLASH